MKRTSKLYLLLVPLISLALILSTALPIFAAGELWHGGLEPQNWTLSGPGTLGRQPTSGPTNTLTLTYNYGGMYGQWHTWYFTATPTATETLTFDWHYLPFHSWYQAKARLYVFNNGTSGPKTTLYDGYGYTEVRGTTTIPVTAGNVFGFQIQAYHFDASKITNGTLTLSRQTANSGGPYTVAEGSSITLNGSGFDPDGNPLTLAWDLDNDGQYDDATGATPTFSAAALDGPSTRNIGLQVTNRPGLFWNFENATSVGGKSTSVGAPTGTTVSGTTSQTGGGPAENWGGSIGIVHLTRFIGPVNYPYIEFTTTKTLLLESITFTHYHNHNSGFPTYNGYQVQLQIDSGSGYGNIGSPLAVNRSNYAQTSTITLGSFSVNPGTYRIRWLATGFSYGDNSNTEFFAINDLTMNLVNPVKGVSNTTVSINNVAPVVNAGPDATTSGSGSFSGSGNFTDPGPDVWTATVNYGDGSGIQPLALTGKTFSLSHVYATSGTFTVTVTVTDDDGGTGTDTLRVVRPDSVAPTTTASRSPLPNPAGWNNTDVTVSFSATDNVGGSGVKEIRYRINGGPETVVPGNTASLLLSSDGAYNISYHAVDNASNAEAPKSLVVKVDKTAPSITGSRTPGPSANGWNNSNVTVHFTASDSLSGVVSVTPDAVVSAEGKDQSVTGTATDAAGNSAIFKVEGINIDKTKPTLVFGAITPAPNGAGWNKSDVTIAYTPADSLSGVDTSTPPTPLSFTTEGTGLKQNVTVTDKAGNSDTFTSPAVNLDKTPPTLIFGTASPAPNAAGWNKTDVSVPFTTADNLSGVAGTTPPSSPVVISAEGAAVTGAATVTDIAGNVASFTTASFKIDKTVPTISGSRTPAGNSYGWNNTDVTVQFTASDSLSGIASLTPDTVLSGEGQNQSVTGTATDIAGNSASFTVNGINIDKTKPTLVFGAITPAPNGAGWNKSDVTIAYTPADGLSGVDTSTPPTPLSFTTEGTGLKQTVTVTDKAGNSDTFTSPAVNLDKTPPTLIFGTASPAPNAAGWNKTDVSVPFTTADNLSGVAGTTPPSSPVVISAEGAAVTGAATVTDIAGNVASFTTASFKIDKTVPTISGSRTPAGNSYGWNNTDVTVQFTASDSLSGIASLTPDTVLSGEGQNQSVTGTATDIAGNSASFTVNSINIDKTKPTLVFGAITPAPNGAGWNKSDVTIAYTPADGLSGVDTSAPPTPLSFTTDGAGLKQTVTVTDKAGNSDTFTSPAVNLDKTPPTLIFGTASPAPNAAGWNKTDVSVPFTTADNLSGVAGTTPPSSPVVISAEGAAVTGAATVTDIAGNVASFTTASFKIDKTVPTISGSRTPAGNSYGWNNTDVTVQFTASDSLSGIASLTPDTVLSGEGQNQSVTGTATDIAGNSASFTVNGINIDKTKPGLVFGPTIPAPNAAGWNNSDVTIVYTTSDNLAGVASSSPASPLFFGTEGAGLTQNVTVVDKADNSNTFTSQAVNLDKTVPTTSSSCTPVGNTYGWNNTDVTVTLSATDSLSGVAMTEYNLDNTGWKPYASPINITAEGVHTFLYRSADRAGNLETARTLTISIDKTAPQAFNQFDPATKNCLVFIRDSGSGATSNSVVLVSVVAAKWGDDKDDRDNDEDIEEKKQDAELRTYRVTDMAGNSVLLVEKVKISGKEGKEVKVKVISFQYDNGPVIKPPKNKKEFHWNVEKDGTLKDLHQNMEVGKGKDKQHIDTHYDAKKNQTDIHVHEPKPEKTHTKPGGLVLLRLVINGNNLVIEY